MGKIRIHGGKHANRQIQFLDSVGIRPTGSRVRTVLFDWLRPMIRGKKCLDLFSGSGILAFDAMSQGAKSVHCIDHNQSVCKQITQEAQRIDENGISVECVSFPISIEGDYDICFMDPPFQEKDLYISSIKFIIQNNLLKAGGFLYIEGGYEMKFDGLQLIKHKRVGGVFMSLYKLIGDCHEG